MYDRDTPDEGMKDRAVEMIRRWVASPADEAAKLLALGALAAIGEPVEVDGGIYWASLSARRIHCLRPADEVERNPLA